MRFSETTWSLSYPVAALLKLWRHFGYVTGENNKADQKETLHKIKRVINGFYFDALAN